MKRALIVLAVVVLGFGLGYRYGRGPYVPPRTVSVPTPSRWNTPQSPPTDATAAPLTTPATSANARRPRDLAASDPAIASPPPSWSAAHDALYVRARDGDGIAAEQWMETEIGCDGLESGFGPLAVIELPRAAVADFRIPLLGADEFAYLTDTAIATTQRQAFALRLQQRIEEHCAGYRPAPRGQRLRLAELAALHGSDSAFWYYASGLGLFDPVNDLAGAGRSREQLDLLRDWMQRVPAVLQQRAERGEARAVFVLGAAYLPGLDGSDDTLPYGFSANLVDDDALQAYRWLTLYLQMGGGDAAMRAQAQSWLAGLAGTLDLQQRAAAEQWARDQRARQSGA